MNDISLINSVFDERWEFHPIAFFLRKEKKQPTDELYTNLRHPIVLSNAVKNYLFRGTSVINTFWFSTERLKTHAIQEEQTLQQ